MSEEENCDYMVAPITGLRNLKLAGELLSNEKSVRIIAALLDVPTYKNKLATDLGIDFSLLVHHLKKLDQLGIVTITQEKLKKNGALHDMYKMNSDGMFVDFKGMLKEKSHGDSRTYRKIFRDNVKFTVISIPAIIAFLLVDLPFFLPHGSQQSTNMPLFVIPLSVLGISIVVTKISLYLKNKFYKTK